MPTVGPLPRFVLLALIIFLLLMSVIPTGLVPPLFRAGANAVFHSMGSNRVALFERFDDPRGVFDTKMSVGSDARGHPTYPSSMGVNSVRQAYVPLALVIALILATPLTWRRKLRALFLGLLLIHGFIALRVGVALLHGFSRIGEGNHRLLEVSAPEAWLLRNGDQILAGDLHITYVAPLLIWLLVAVRVEDLRALRGTDGSCEPGAESVKLRRNSPCPCESGRKYKHCCGKGQSVQD